jgi:hypothetical protein
VPGCPGRLALQGIHPGLEIGPSLVGDLDLGLGDGSGVFPEDVQQDEQVAGSTVQDPVELPTVVAPQFSQIART